MNACDALRKHTVLKMKENCRLQFQRNKEGSKKGEVLIFDIHCVL